VRTNFYCLSIADGRRFLTVDFGNSLNESVLKLYPAVDESSAVSHVCLKFDVKTSSSAVQLLVALSDMSEDGRDGTIGQVTSESRASYRPEVFTGRQSINVLRGRQYVVFTAKKIKFSRRSDTVTVHSISYTHGPCRNHTASK